MQGNPVLAKMKRARNFAITNIKHVYLKLKIRNSHDSAKSVGRNEEK